MKRNVNINDISDGRLYMADDMVRADCHGCEGCSACCQGMGDSLILDPLDIWHLKRQLHISFEKMLTGIAALGVVDGVVLPHIKMEGSDERCYFLNDEGRCRIHEFRPGICRLFPLGRIYDNHSFKYFLQVNECPKRGRSKVRVRQWIGISDLNQYEQFVNAWHYFLNDVEAWIMCQTDPQQIRTMNLQILTLFYIQDFDQADFYAEANARMQQIRDEFLQTHI